MDEIINHAMWGPTVTSGASVFIHKRIAEQTRKNPEAIALFSDEEKITFEDLNVRANRICSLIQEFSDQKHAFIGVSMKRSSRLIETLLGILKANCAYVPLDPAYPAERLSDILHRYLRPYGLC